MADDSSLTVRITADTGSTPSDLQAVADKISAMEAELQRLRAAHDTTGAAAESHAAKETILGESVGKVSTATNALGRVFSAVGFQVGEATERVEGFGEALEGLEAAAAPLLVVAAGLLAAAAAANTLIDGIKDAGATDAALGQIASNVHATGAAFDSTKEQVRKWAEDLSSSTGASAESLISSVQKMTAAGIPLRTALALNKVAELESIASGRGLAEVQGALEQAYLGHTRALVSLGIISKDEAKNGIELSVVNERILASTRASVEVYQNSLPGALSIASARFKILSETIGNDFLSALIAGAKSLDDFLARAQLFADDVGPSIRNAIADTSKAFGAINAALEPFQNALDGVRDELQTFAGDFQDTWSSLASAIDEFYSRAKPALDAIGVAIQQLAGAGLQTMADSFTTALDEITAAIDAFRGVVTGNWTRFRDDLVLILGDGLKQLDDETGGHLAQIIASFQTGLDTIRSAISDAASVMFAPYMDAIKLVAEGASMWWATQLEAYHQFATDAESVLGDVATAYKTFATTVEGVVDSLATSVGNAFHDLYERLDDMTSGNLSKIVAAWQTASSQIFAKAAAVSDVIGGMAGNPALLARGVEEYQQLSGGVSTYTEHLKAAQAALAGVAGATDRIRGARGGGSSAGPGFEGGWGDDGGGMLQDRELGGESAKKPKAETEPFVAKIDTSSPFSSDADSDAQRALSDNLKEITSGELAFQRAVDDATTSQQKQTAEWDLAQKKVDVAQASINALAIAIDGEQKKLDGLNNDTLPKQIDAFEAAQVAVNTYQIAMGKDPSKDERAHLEELKTKLEAAKTAVAATHAEVEKLSSVIQTNSDKLAENAKALDTVNAKLAESERVEQEYVDKAIVNLSEQAVKEDEARKVKIQNIETENALYGLSLAQQLAYYREHYANEVAAGQVDTDQAKADFDKILSLEQDEYKQRLDAQKAFIQNAQSFEATFIGDILDRHKSLRDNLKSIFTDIVDDFTKMIEQMIVKSALLNGLNSQLAKIFNIGGGGTAGGIAGGSGLGPLAQDTPGGNLVIDAGSQTVTALTGSPTGVTPTFGATDPDVYDASSGALIHSGSSTPSSSSGGSGAFGSVLQGVGIGDFAAGLDGGNSTNGMLGGGVGSLIGLALHANPLIGAGIDLVTGLAGSLFGNHETAAKDPDDFEGQTGYGQDVADLQFGQSGADGTAYYPDAAIAKFVASMNVGAGTITGGANQGQQATNSNGTIASSGGVDAAEMWLSQNSGDTSAQLEQMGVSPAQFANWVKLLGSSSTGSGQYSHIAGDPNVGDIEVTGATTGGGTKTTTAALAAALQSIVSASGSSSSTTSDVFTVARTMPNMNIGTLQADGTYSQTAGEVNEPTVQGTTPIAPLPTAGTVSAGSTTIGTGNASADNTTTPIGFGNISMPVNITLTGDNVIASDSAMQDLAEKLSGAMSVALSRLQSGSLFGGLALAARARSGNI